MQVPAPGYPNLGPPGGGVSIGAPAPGFSVPSHDKHEQHHHQVIPLFSQGILVTMNMIA